MRDEERVAHGASWGWLGLLALTHFLMMADRNLPVLVLPVLKQTFALSDTRLGLLQGPAFVLFYVVATLVAGRIVDRAPRLLLLALSVVLWSAASVGFGLATRWEQLVACRLLLGLFQAFVAPASLSLIFERAPRADVGRFVSIFTTGSALGRSGALLLGGALLAWSATPAVRALAPGLEAWRILFFLSTLPNLAATLGLLASRRGGETVSSGTLRPSMRSTLTWFRAWPAAFSGHLLASGGVIIVVQAVAAWGPTLMQRELAMSPAQSGLAAGLIVIIGAPLGHLGGGTLIDHCRRAGWPVQLVTIGGLAMCVLGAALLCVPASISSIASGLFLLTAFGGMAAAASLAAFQPMAPRAHGAANAIYFAIITLMGLGLGPPVIGVLTDRLFGSGSLGLALLSVTTAMAIAVMLLLLGTREAYGRAVQAAETTRHPTSPREGLEIDG